MKTIKLKTLATGIVATLILFTGCKKATNGETGPAGAQGPAGIIMSSDGFIKGTLAGFKKDGTTLNEQFNFANYFAAEAGTLDSSNFGGVPYYSFNFTRSSDLFGSNGASISILSTSLSSTATCTVTLNNFSFAKTIGTRKEFVFTQNSGGTPTQSVITLAYNKSTGLVTGMTTISIPGSQNSTGTTANVILSFQSTITQMYYMKKLTGVNAQ